MIPTPSVQHQHTQDTLEPAVLASHILETVTEAKLNLFDGLPDTPIMPSGAMFPGHLRVESTAFAMPDGLSPDAIEPVKHQEHPLVQKRRKISKDDGFIKELAEDLENKEPEAIADFEDGIIDDLKPINEPFEGIEEGIEGAVDTLASDIYPEADDWLQ